MDTYKPRSYSSHEHEQFAAAWEAAVTAYGKGDTSALSAEVTGVGVIRKMGRAGDAPGQYPLVQTIDAIPHLRPFEQWAIDQVYTVVAETQEETARRIGQQVYQVADAQGKELPFEERLPIHTFDPTRHGELLISFPLSGGRA